MQVLDHKGHRIGSDPEVGRMTKRQQSRIAQEQIKPEGRNRHDQTVRQYERLIGIGQIRYAQQQHGDGCHSEEEAERFQRADSNVSASHRAPKRPVGRTRRTTAAMRYSTASSISGKNMMPTVRSTPTMSAPTRAPRRLPSPPTTTTTKARMRASVPIPSTAACPGTMMAPPRPAMVQPRANACTYTFFTLTPK